MTERSTPQENQKPIEQANPEAVIVNFLNSYLKTADLNRPPSSHWSTLRSQQITHFGTNSIVILLPQELSGGAAGTATRIVNTLRHKGHIKTTQQLLEAQEESLNKIEGISDKSIPLILAMKALAAQRLVERN